MRGAQPVSRRPAADRLVGAFEIGLQNAQQVARLDEVGGDDAQPVMRGRVEADHRDLVLPGLDQQEHAGRGQSAEDGGQQHGEIAQRARLAPRPAGPLQV